MRSTNALIVLASLLSGCSDGGHAECVVVPGPNGMPLPDNCLGAIIFVARDSATLVPAQRDLDRYYERWGRVVEAEPVLHRRGPQRYRIGIPMELWTSNPKVIEAFVAVVYNDGDRAVPLTGDPVFDEIMSELVAPQVVYQSKGLEEGTVIFSLATSAIVNEELFHQRLLPTGSYLPDPVVHRRDDGTWSWLGREPGTGADDATAQIDFTFGWGDCPAGCGGLHHLRAIVPPTGPATVYDLGGDELPDHLSLSPNTRPLP